jgi:hypothetical protein
MNILVNEIILSDRILKVEKYEEEKINGLHKITIDFKVTSEDYHDVAVLLYEGTFDVKVPSQNLSFRGTIQEYSTSITNLYEKGNVGDYHLSLLEVDRGSKL